MSGLSQAMATHLNSGITTLCRAWAITRRDGVTYGFTDHDMALSFDGITFAADSGLTAAALSQSTGLSVDNSEAIGALSDAAISEADIEAGRFDQAEVMCWLVNWQDVSERWMQFRGSLGELRRAGGAFTAELRGLTDALNQPIGRVYQKPCTAVLGDAKCGCDLNGAAFSAQATIESVEDARVFTFAGLSAFEVEWFARGRLELLDGAASGLWGAIKRDETVSGGRLIELWEPIRAAVAVGDQVELRAGCDKRAQTCREKFNNFLNFQGFPDLPGEDWLVAVPKQSGRNSGGSLR